MTLIRSGLDLHKGIPKDDPSYVAVEKQVHANLEEICALMGRSERDLSQLKSSLQLVVFPGHGGCHAAENEITFHQGTLDGSFFGTVAEESVHYFDNFQFPKCYTSLKGHQGFELVGRLFSNLHTERNEEKFIPYSNNFTFYQIRVQKKYELFHDTLIPKLIAQFQEINEVITNDTKNTSHETLRKAYEENHSLVGVYVTRIEEVLRWSKENKNPDYSRENESIPIDFIGEYLPLLLEEEADEFFPRDLLNSVRSFDDTYDDAIKLRNDCEKHKSYVYADSIFKAYQTFMPQMRLQFLKKFLQTNPEERVDLYFHLVDNTQELFN